MRSARAQGKSVSRSARSPKSRGRCGSRCAIEVATRRQHGPSRSTLHGRCMCSDPQGVSRTMSFLPTGSDATSCLRRRRNESSLMRPARSRSSAAAVIFGMMPEFHLASVGATALSRSHQRITEEPLVCSRKFEYKSRLVSSQNSLFSRALVVLSEPPPFSLSACVSLALATQARQ